MSKVRVLACAFTSDREHWARLRDSCFHHAAPLTVLGEGRAFPEYEIYAEWIDILNGNAFAEEYVAYTCSYDAFMTRWSESDLIARTDQAGGLLVSTEASCWPSGPWGLNYPAGGRAANGGQYCGRREQVRDLMAVMLKRIRAGEVVAGGGNQEILHRMVGEMYPMELDLKSDIYHSMAGIGSSQVVMDNRLVRNPETGTSPMFLHFNGRTPGIDDWYGRVYGT